MIELRVVTDVRDVPTLVRLVADYYAHDGLAFDAADMMRALTTLVETPAYGRACLVEIDRVVAGYTVFTFGFDAEFGGRLATITDFFLTEAARGHGAGAEVVAQVEALCRSLGVVSIELHVIRGNDVAARFWTKRGFETLARVPMSKRL
jgi:GNAT superfamily N-acetyltransferase